MQIENRFLDDLARIASGAMGAAAGMKGEVETRLRRQLERILANMDLVRREEFDAVKAMAAKARAEQEVLAERVTALEAGLEKPKARTPRRGTKTAPGKTAAGGKPKGAGSASSRAKKPG